MRQNSIQEVICFNGVVKSVKHIRKNASDKINRYCIKALMHDNNDKKTNKLYKFVIDDRQCGSHLMSTILYSIAEMNDISGVCNSVNVPLNVNVNAYHKGDRYFINKVIIELAESGYKMTSIPDTTFFNNPYIYNDLRYAINDCPDIKLYKDNNFATNFLPIKSRVLRTRLLFINRMIENIIQRYSYSSIVSLICNYETYISYITDVLSDTLPVDIAEEVLSHYKLEYICVSSPASYLKTNYSKGQYKSEAYNILNRASEFAQVQALKLYIRLMNIPEVKFVRIPPVAHVRFGFINAIDMEINNRMPYHIKFSYTSLLSRVK